MITVRFACGHPTVTVADDHQAPPVCPACRERRVQFVTAPAPKFRGLCVGPSATTAALDALPMSLKG